MRNRKLFIMAGFALIAATFNACLEDPEPIALDVIADVYVQKSIQNGEVKYAPSFWVFANKSLESVTAKGPDNESWDLEKDDGSSMVFSLIPETAQHTDSMPLSGDYIFTITSTQSDEAPITIVDKLENKELGAVAIDSTHFENSRLNVLWTAVPNADNYVVRLYDESEKLIYISPLIANNKTEFSFGNTDSGWANASTRATAGNNYRAELVALLYESTSTSNNRNFNIQFISIASKDITWE